MNELDKLARFYGTDKSSDIHNYCVKYEKYLPFKRDDKIKILEIGVLGGASVKMWNKYFYNSLVVGIDIKDDCKEYETENIKIEIGDQTNEKFLDYIYEKYGDFDLIIDDGSHINSDTIKTFKILFQRHLKSGGIYVVEDSVTSYYPDYGGDKYKIGTIIEFFKETVDEVNFFGEQIELDKIHPITGMYEMNRNRRDDDLLAQFKKKGYDYLGIQIESLNFLNSLIIITKR